MRHRQLFWTTVPALLLLFLLVTAGEALVQLGIPALRSAFEWVAADFRVLHFELDREKADRVLRASVTLGRYTFVGGQLVAPDPRGVAQASTVAMHGLQGPMLVLWTSMAWPAGKVATRALRLLACLPAATLLFLLDAPVVLAAGIWDFLVAAHAPDSWQPLLIARDLLQGGGRVVIGLAIGAAGGIAIGRAESG